MNSYYTEIFVWGDNKKGQLGIQGEQEEITKVKSYSFDVQVSKVSCGLDHSGFITTEGLIFVMGSNQNGKLGIGSTFGQTPWIKSPMLVSSLATHKMKEIQFSDNHSLALSTNNLAFTWGYAKDGALGYQIEQDCQLTPRQVQIKDVERIFIGKQQSAFITKHGKALVCGRNKHSCLGQGDNKEILFEPAELQIKDQKIDSISFGNSYHTLILTQSLKVFAVGHNSHCQLGLGNNIEQATPVEIPSLSDKFITNILACDYSMAWTSSGQLYVWGLKGILLPFEIKLDFQVAQCQAYKDQVWLLSDIGDLFSTTINELIQNTSPHWSICQNIQQFASGSNSLIALGNDLLNSRISSKTPAKQAEIMYKDKSMNSIAYHSIVKDTDHNQNLLSLMNSPYISPYTQVPRKINNTNAHVSISSTDPLKPLTDVTYPNNKHSRYPKCTQFNERVSIETSLSPARNMANKENSYFRDKEKLLKEQIHSQDIQIQFLKEKLAKLEVTSDNEKRDLTKKCQLLEQRLQKKDQLVEQQEIKLGELKEQITLIKEHYESLQDIMKRDQKDREKQQCEISQLHAENKKLVKECEQYRLSLEEAQEEKNQMLQSCQDLLSKAHQQIEHAGILEDEQAQKLIEQMKQDAEVLIQENEILKQKKDRQKQVLRNLREHNQALNQKVLKMKYKLKNAKMQNTRSLTPTASCPNQLTFAKVKGGFQKRQENDTPNIDGPLLCLDGMNSRQIISQPRTQQRSRQYSSAVSVKRKLDSEDFSQDQRTTIDGGRRQKQPGEPGFSKETLSTSFDIPTANQRTQNINFLDMSQEDVIKEMSEFESTLSSPIASKRKLQERIKAYENKLLRLLR